MILGIIKKIQIYQFKYYFQLFIMQNIHHLSDEWIFWYAIRGKQAKDANHYQENLKQIGMVCSIQKFFQYYCFLKRPSEMQNNHKIMFFRKGCKPMWEQWKQGGCWIWLSNKKDQHTLLDRKWESLLFACIGEQFETSQVVGVVLSKREKHTLLQVWISNRSQSLKLKLAEKLNQIMNLQASQLKFHFKDHNISLQKNSTMRGSQKYTFVKTPMQTPLIASLENNQQLENFQLK